MRALKHFTPWEHILLPGSYFGLRVLIYFWMKIVWFFWLEYLNKFSIKTCYSPKYDSILQEAKCFNTPNLHTTNMHFYNSSINIGFISFFSSSDMRQSHHLSGCHAKDISSSLNSFLSSLRFLNLVWLTKKLSWLEKICLTKKVFWLEKKLKQFA